MAEDKFGRIWVGSYQQGCGWVDGESAAYHPVDINDGGSASIFGMDTDKSGNIWFATRRHGICIYNGKIFTSFDKIFTKLKADCDEP